MTVYVGGASIDENGRAYGGKAGNQTGKELRKQPWYLHSKGWRVFRAKSIEAAERIAVCMERAIKNMAIGYDQYQRNTLYTAAEPVGFDTSKVKTPCETDCSALVRVCCAFAGIMGLPAEFRTANEPSYLLKTGAFTELTGSKYQSQSSYLGRGDILVTKTSGHTVVVLSNGNKYEGEIEARAYAPGERILRHGCEGKDVQTMQQMLIDLNYDLGKYGADGDFGDCTDLAVRAFQRDHALNADGECGPITWAALNKAIDAMAENTGCADSCPLFVVIEGGDCYIRTAPNTDGMILGVAKRGTELHYGGQVSDNGWLLVEYNGVNAWVSGKYARPATDAAPTAPAVSPIKRGLKIVDISKWQPDVDYDALIKDTALVILRAGLRDENGAVRADEKFIAHAAALTARGIRFGVYFFSRANTESKAKEEADALYKLASMCTPLFYALDAEEAVINQSAIRAFVVRMRALGASHVGAYVAHHRYDQYGFADIRHLFDFVWLPRYGKNDGTITGATYPDYPCDLWQYTSTGKVDGISGNVDLSAVTGQGRSLEWFLGGESK